MSREHYKACTRRDTRSKQTRRYTEVAVIGIGLSTLCDLAPPHGRAPYLVHVYVVEVLPVVYGFEEALELPDCTAVDHQHERHTHRIIHLAPFVVQVIALKHGTGQTCGSPVGEGGSRQAYKQALLDKLLLSINRPIQVRKHLAQLQLKKTK